MTKTSPLSTSHDDAARPSTGGVVAGRRDLARVADAVLSASAWPGFAAAGQLSLRVRDAVAVASSARRHRRRGGGVATVHVYVAGVRSTVSVAGASGRACRAATVNVCWPSADRRENGDAARERRAAVERAVEARAGWLPTKRKVASPELRGERRARRDLGVRLRDGLNVMSSTTTAAARRVPSVRRCP